MKVDLQHCHVLDGGFATELERRGYSLAGPLWSARLLGEAPSAILDVHRAYLDAGADVLETASYQVSTLGFQQAGIAREEAVAKAAHALRESVRLACQAREEAARPEVLVAASLGPYGAALANGAEYHGEYGFADAAGEHAALVAFHRERIAVLSVTDADFLAFETVPSRREAVAIVEALRSFPGLLAWISFTCKDAQHTGSGDALRACAAWLQLQPQVIALGINCTAPRLILPLLQSCRAALEKPIVVYPNSGERWDGLQRCWLGSSDPAAYEDLASQWFAAGATVVGGCCRTGPEHVRAVAAAAPRAADGQQRAHSLFGRNLSGRHLSSHK